MFVTFVTDSDVDDVDINGNVVHLRCCKTPISRSFSSLMNFNIAVVFIFGSLKKMTA